MIDIKREINKREDVFRGYMEEQGLEGSVIMNPENLYYLSGFRSIFYSRPIYGVILSKTNYLIIPTLEEQTVSGIETIENMVVYHEHPERASEGTDPILALKKVVGSPSGSGRIGVEMFYTPTEVTDSLRTIGWETRDVGKYIHCMRMIKSDYEIELIRIAAKLTSRAVQASLSVARTGTEQLYLEQAGNEALLSYASELCPNSKVQNLLVMTLTGKDSVIPHTFTPRHAYMSGDISIHSRQAGVDGYHAECERSFGIGKLDAKVEDIFRVTVEAQQAAIDAVKPGTACSELDRVARDIYKKYGYNEYYIHRCGHGVGLSLHEWPFLRFDNHEPLVPRMAFTVEPAIFIPGLAGARHSDSVLVTDTGKEVLTTGTKKIEELMF